MALSGAEKVQRKILSQEQPEAENRMKREKKAAIVCCSNGRRRSEEGKIQELEQVLRKMGVVPVFSDRIYTEEGQTGPTGRERAEELMKFYRDDSIREIFDLSGGDIANEILPYLDYETIACSGKRFWGYSDLTAVINAFNCRTGNESVLYQVKNLVGEYKEVQREAFRKYLFQESDELTRFSCQFIQKNSMEGVTAGGNIRCLLKLAGTPYWPDLRGKILILEALGGRREQLITYLSQLEQLGAFEQAAGILLGTFTTMEKEESADAVCKLVRHFAGGEMPVAKTQEIGHGEDSKAAVIGGYLKLLTKSGY